MLRSEKVVVKIKICCRSVTKVLDSRSLGGWLVRRPPDGEIQDILGRARKTSHVTDGTKELGLPRVRPSGAPAMVKSMSDGLTAGNRDAFQEAARLNGSLVHAGPRIIKRGSMLR